MRQAEACLSSHEPAFAATWSGRGMIMHAQRALHHILELTDLTRDRRDRGRGAHPRRSASAEAAAGAAGRPGLLCELCRCTLISAAVKLMHQLNI